MNMTLPGFFENNQSEPLNSSHVIEFFTRNLSSNEIGYVEGMVDFQAVVYYVEQIFVPIISILGLIGNLLSAVTFSSKGLRKSRCSLLIAAKCINDIAFLLCLLFVWVSVTFDLGLIHVFGACHGLIYITFFSGFMAVWLCGCITCENYLLISNRLTMRRWNAIKTPIVWVGVLACAGALAYVPTFWMTNEICDINPEQLDLTQTIAYMDIFLTFIFPVAVIIVLLVLISLKINQVTYEKKRRMSSVSMFSMTSSVAPSIPSPAERVTRMLFVYCILLVILHCPSHAMTLYLLINIAKTGTTDVTNNMAALRTGLQMMFYLGFTINFFVFFSLSINFRKEFLKIFCCRKSKFRPIRTDARPRLYQRRHTIEGLLNIEEDPELMTELNSILRTHRCNSQ